MNAGRRRALVGSLYSHALAVVDPARLVTAACRRLPESSGSGCRLDVFAIGKAAAGLFRGAERALLGRIRSAFVVGPSAELGPLGDPALDVESLVGGHPIPDAQSFVAGRRALDWLRERDRPDRTILFLVSGGASAMLEVPAPGWDEPSVVELNGNLLRSGLPIVDVNLLRARASRIKAGGLGAAAASADRITMVLSDVPPGQDHYVASGPTVDAGAWGEHVRDRTLAAAARLELSVGLRRRLEADSSECAAARRGRWCLLADRDTMLRELGRHVEGALGLTAEVLGAGFGDGPVSDIADAHVERFERADAEGQTVVFLSSGEADVRVRGAGRGGRNQELALRVAVGLARKGLGCVSFASLGTDGIDGVTPVAGAVVDAETTLRIRSACGPGSVEALLDANDSFRALSASQDLVTRGPTGCNVGDLRIGVVAPSRRVTVGLA